MKKELFDYLTKKVGRILLTRLPDELNPLHQLAVIVWMIRTDLLKETIKLFAAASILMNALLTRRLIGIHTIVVCSSGNFAWAIACIAPDFGHFKIIAIGCSLLLILCHGRRGCGK